MADIENVTPRDKAVQFGINYLSNEELLALLIRVGTKKKNYLDISRELIKFSGGIEKICRLGINDLVKIKGISEIKAIEILSAIEFGKRVRIAALNNKNKTVATDRNIYDYLVNDLEMQEKEFVAVVFISSQNYIVGHRIVSIGTINGCDCAPRDIFKAAINSNARSIVVVHNHPSDIPNPSKDDIEVTKQMLLIGNFLGIKVKNHLIICTSSYYSLIEHCRSDKKLSKVVYN